MTIRMVQRNFFKNPDTTRFTIQNHFLFLFFRMVKRASKDDLGELTVKERRVEIIGENPIVSISEVVFKETMLPVNSNDNDAEMKAPPIEPTEKESDHDDEVIFYNTNNYFICPHCKKKHRLLKNRFFKSI